MSQLEKNIEKIDGALLWKKFLSGFDLKRGTLFTLVQLTLRPGTTILKYVRGERKLLNPFKYLLKIAPLFVFLNYLHVKFDPITLDLNDQDLIFSIIPYFLQVFETT